MITNNYNDIFAAAVALPPEESTKKGSTTSSTTAGETTASRHEVTEDNVQRLLQQGFTRGLSESFSKNLDSFPNRIWIVDNSGSMHKDDGHRIVDTVNASEVRSVPCSRWEEIRECVNYHIRMADMLKAPTSFRLLNKPGNLIGPQKFGVGNDFPSSEDSTTVSSSAGEAIQIMANVRPCGATPLTAHIHEIHQKVKLMAPNLQEEGKRVVIVIATDGLPTDEFGVGGSYQNQVFTESLRLLEGLPVWVVIRLCTDEDDVVNFYNELDEQLELSLEVLDDFCGEALEVYEHNPWLNYALPLHRCREMGYHDRVFDLIDERALTKTEIRDFCKILFGDSRMDGVPDPSLDWIGFLMDIERLLKDESPQWNPMKKRLTPWIDTKALDRKYRRSTGCLPGCVIS